MRIQGVVPVSQATEGESVMRVLLENSISPHAHLASVAVKVHTMRYAIHSAVNVPVDTVSGEDNAISAPPATTTSLTVGGAAVTR